MVEYGSPLARNAYRLAMHLALIVGAIIFSMPFVWMFSTSVKEDDEQQTEELVWMPRLPPYQPASPFIDAREGTQWVRPQEIGAARWKQIEPLVAETLAARLKDVPFDCGATPKAEAGALLRAAVWRDIAHKIPLNAFKDEAALKAEILRLCTDRQLAESHRRVFRALALGDVTLRPAGAMPTHVPVRAGDQPNGKLLWNIPENSPLTHCQTFWDGKPEEELHYKFDQAGDKATFTAVVPYTEAAPPKAFTLGLRSDASWNHLFVALEWHGQRWETVDPTLLNGTGKNFFEALYQLPSPDDDNDMRIHYWGKTRAVPGSGFFAENGQVKIEATLVNTSAGTKLWNKATSNYFTALNYIPFWRYLGTSVFLTVMNVFLAMFSCSLIAYSFARLRWPGREVCWAILLGTIMIPGQVTMIPGFLIIKWLGWYNTLYPLWVGSAFGSVFFIFMLRQFMKNIPKDLEDAAKIDGCSYWQIYWNVVLPLVKPTLAAIGIFTFMGSWNNFMGPLMYVTDQRNYPLSLGLFAFQTVSGANSGIMMAASVLMTLPVIVLFFVAQKQFIQGVTFTGLKG